MTEIELVTGFVQADNRPGDLIDLDTDDVVGEDFVHGDNCPYCGNPHVKKNRPFRSDDIVIECRHCEKEFARYHRIDCLFIRL